MPGLKLYLDNCCYNRPYDSHSVLSNSLESQAKLHIQDYIRKENAVLITSFVLAYEISQMPMEYRRSSIQKYIEENASIEVDVGCRDRVKSLAKEIMSTGIKMKDAYHLASAKLAEADYFITTDKRLLKYKDNNIVLINPVDFIQILEEDIDE